LLVVSIKFLGKGEVFVRVIFLCHFDDGLLARCLDLNG